ncbi:MAG: S41 family peptidase [Armatimonadetes bacterium]|nr:S41 family peptidase [Anaerolineae bacterium]
MPTPPPMQIDHETRQTIVEAIARTLHERYVFPEMAMLMHDALHTALATHAYDDLTAPDALCERLTADLQVVSHDKHLRVHFNAEPRSVGVDDQFSPDRVKAWLEQARRANFGVYKAERLAGNIGYLDLRNFWDTSFEGCSETVIGALAMLTYTDALLLDMRQNGGGSPSMVALVISYLVGAEPVHLNDFYERTENKTRQSWTLAYVPGRRTPDKPLYVLTSARTFSGAEEFAYNLQQLKRATIIGETTGGGAHPGDEVSVTPHFRVFVPMGRPINPISGTNWEGTGVIPDIAVPQETAFNAAYRLALREVLTKLEADITQAAQLQAHEARIALTELAE